MSVRVAACAYPIERLESFAAYAAKQAAWVGEAARAGAQLLVFPEYASMELGSVLPTDVQGELARELAALQPLLPALLEVHRELSQRHGVWIAGPSFPEYVHAAGEYRNRMRIHAPSGAEALQEKLMMTRFEREDWDIAAGSGQRVFESALGCFGVAVCYDSEFPLLVRRLVVAGAEIVLVPSCTDTLAGYHRVQLSCRARALENQCYVVQACTVGSAPWSCAVDENRGAAGIYGPVDRGFPSDGVLALGKLDEPGWVYADLEPARLAEVRGAGQVKNHADWDAPQHLNGAPLRVRM